MSFAQRSPRTQHQASNHNILHLNNANVLVIANDQFGARFLCVFACLPMLVADPRTTGMEPLRSHEPSDAVPGTQFAAMTDNVKKITRTQAASFPAPALT
jgi:hypothetical protein